MAPRAITDEERQTVQQLVARAQIALNQIADYDQARVDRLIQAVGWALSNEKTFTRLSNMGVDESGLGDRQGRPSKRFKLHGILRDALRAKSMGIVEEDHVKGITKYAKPVGIIASLVPVTNAGHTEIGNGIYSLKCKNAIIFAPHPAGKKTSIECVRMMREAVKKLGCPEDVFQVIEKPSIPMAQELMAQCDLTIATGGQQMVRAAYSSGKPAYGVGAGNATMVIDETADIDIAARNTRISKTSDNGSGCSADGNLIVDARIYDKFLDALQKEGGYLVSPAEKVQLQMAMWDEERHRTSNTIARPAKMIAEIAGFKIGDDKKFLIVPETHIGKDYLFSSEKLSPVLSIIRYEGGFDEALNKVEQIYKVGGRGHSCGIYSHNDEHIHRLALMAPVSRMMVRQPQSKANAGAWDNGMPMTSSMGCGIWGGNITNENVNVKHYMQLTWVSRPIPEDRPSEQELFGEFFNTETP